MGSLTPEATMQTLLSFLLIFTLPIVSHGYFGYFWDSADPEEKFDVARELQNLKERIAVLEDGLSALQNKSNIVYFSAQFRGQSIGADPLRFGQIMSNVGGGRYNITEGTYECPVSGLYHVHAHIMRRRDIENFGLYHNDTLLVGFQSRDYSGQGFSDSGSVYVECLAGDTVRAGIQKSQPCPSCKPKSVSFYGGPYDYLTVALIQANYIYRILNFKA